MILQLILLFTLLVSIAIALGVRWHFKRQQRTYRIPKVVIVLAFLFVLIFGVSLTPLFYFQLQKSLEIAQWPTVQGTIVESKVVGDRAFRPDVDYVYTVDGNEYSGTSYLNLPGFGGRTSRFDAAEKLVNQYPKGSSVTVYYNPENPQQSTLLPKPSYSHYLALTTSALLFLVGFTILLIWRFRPDNNILKERE